MNKYESKIVSSLLKKYYKRKSTYKDAKVNQRISLKVDKVLKNYDAFNVDIQKKELVNQAISQLLNKGFLDVQKIEFSDDYAKLYLVEDNIEQLEQYAAQELNLTPRSFVVEDLLKVMKKYTGKQELVTFYLKQLEDVIENKAVALDLQKEEDLLKILAFLEDNDEYLYLREASMLIFGDSKYFETNRKSQVQTILRDYFQSIGEDVYEEENLLERYNIQDTDQEICIKGDIVIEFEHKKLNIEGLTGGVSFSIKDIDLIKQVIVNSDKIITVENKTSFLRMNDDCCYVYLGGFATKPQITFIKKIIADNPNQSYLHFGDIDAGGFWIHKKLCEQSEHDFHLFHMSKKDLENPQYQSCLKELTETDCKRLEHLKEDERYKECIEYMLAHQVKLEQEIISYAINQTVRIREI